MLAGVCKEDPFLGVRFGSVATQTPIKGILQIRAKWTNKQSLLARFRAAATVIEAITQTLV